MGKKPVLMGFVGSLVLLALYFGIITAASSFEHGLEQLRELWYWMTLLVAGFGVQVGFYAYIRAQLKARRTPRATASVATTGGVSTTSMIACCAHHLVDVLPILGLSAAALFLAKYQLLFLVAGVLSNLIGITLMLGILQTHRLFDPERGILRKALRYNMKAVRNAMVALSVVILALVVMVS